MKTNAPPPKEKRRALGRGLGALLPSSSSKSNASTKPTVSKVLADKVSNPLDAPAAPTKASAPLQSASPSKVPAAALPNRVFFKASVEDIYPSPEQPRRRFDDALLNELAQSIKNHGVIQPLIVRKRSEGGYFLIAGERRWRASQRAGVTDIPIVVQDVTPKQAFERAIVENVQRADLNIIEEAEAYQRLLQEHDLTQEQVSLRVGKDRSTVANAVRLLKLPNSVRAMVESNALSMGHARALLSLPNATEIEKIAKTVVSKGLSVRAVEALIRKKQNPSAPKPKTPAKSASVRDVESKLTKALGAQVALLEDKSGKGGQIEIQYADLDDLDRLLERLLGY